MIEEKNQKTFDLIMRYSDISQSILDKLTGNDKNIQMDILMHMPQQYLWMFGSNFEQTNFYNDRYVYQYDMHSLAVGRGERGDLVAIIPVNHTESDREISTNLRKIIANAKRLALLSKLDKLDKKINNCNNDLLSLWVAQRNVLQKRYENVNARVTFNYLRSK